jgi:hypothetical protein
MVFGVSSVIVLWALIHDLVLVQIAPEHFTEYHEPLDHIQSPIVIATLYALGASIGPGMLMGIAAAGLGRRGPRKKTRPALSYSRNNFRSTCHGDHRSGFRYARLSSRGGFLSPRLVPGYDGSDSDLSNGPDHGLSGHVSVLRHFSQWGLSPPSTPLISQESPRSLKDPPPRLRIVAHGKSPRPIP